MHWCENNTVVVNGVRYTAHAYRRFKERIGLDEQGLADMYEEARPRFVKKFWSKWKVRQTKSKGRLAKATQCGRVLFIVDENGTVVTVMYRG